MRSVALLCAVFSMSLAPKPLTLHVSPKVSFAPATLRIRLRVHPDERDRWIRVALEGDAFATSHEWTIATDQTLYGFDFKDVPSGEYIVDARIGHTGGNLCASDRQAVQVVTVGP